MNLEESNSFMEEEQKNERRKKSVAISIGFCAVLIVILLILIFLIKQKDASTLKMFIDGTQINMSATLFKTVDGKNYINVREISQMLGYTYTKGEYQKYNEDEKSCYLTNGYEIVALSSDSNTFTKYSEFSASEPIIAEIEVTVKSEDGQSQKYNLDSPIKYIDNMIYVPFESLPDMLNTQVDLSEANRIRLYSLQQIVMNGKNIIGQLGFQIMSDEFENLKAMVYNYAVVGNENYYGVVSLVDGNPIISLQYDDITFIPNLQDFLVKATSSDGNTVGIFASDGTAVITPKKYDEIFVYDEDNQLYLVRNDDKYGILNRKGEIIIYDDYDEIGYDNAKEIEIPDGVGNYKVLFNKCIPVKDGSKYGLYDVEGNELLAAAYDGLLYDVTKSEDAVAGEKSVFVIPESVGIKGVVINQNDAYGIYDIEAGRIIIPIVCTKVFATTREGKTTYYLVYNDMTLELEQYLKDNDLVSVGVDNETEETDAEPVSGTNDTTTNTTTDSSNTSSEGNPTDEQANGTQENVVDSGDTSEVVETE